MKNIYRKEREEIHLENTLRLNLRNIIEESVNWNNYFSYRAEYHNLKTTIGKGLVLDTLGEMVGANYKGITYGAVGTGTTAATEADTQLQTESARNASTYSRSGTTGTFSVFFNSGEANVVIAEIGFFGGNASATANSGKIFNRIVLSSTVTKTNSYTLTLDLDCEVS